MTISLAETLLTSFFANTFTTCTPGKLKACDATPYSLNALLKLYLYLTFVPDRVKEENETASPTALGLSDITATLLIGRSQKTPSPTHPCLHIHLNDCPSGPERRHVAFGWQLCSPVTHFPFLMMSSKRATLSVLSFKVFLRFSVERSASLRASSYKAFFMCSLFCALSSSLSFCLTWVFWLLRAFWRFFFAPSLFRFSSVRASRRYIERFPNHRLRVLITFPARLRRPLAISSAIFWAIWLILLTTFSSAFEMFFKTLFASLTAFLRRITFPVACIKAFPASLNCLLTFSATFETCSTAFLATSTTFVATSLTALAACAAALIACSAAWANAFVESAKFLRNLPTSFISSPPTFKPIFSKSLTNSTLPTKLISPSINAFSNKRISFWNRSFIKVGALFLT